VVVRFVDIGGIVDHLHCVLFPPSSCKKQINKQNSYLLLAFFQSGSVPELDMHESKHFLPGQFVHSEDGQQFHQYQQNEQPPKTIEQLKKRQHTCMELEIQLHAFFFCILLFIYLFFA
jgi:hypothetical protein